jgi:hypothetical protein
MAMLVIRTQYRENYGTEDQPYWKNKGGQEYKVKNVPLNENFEVMIRYIDGIEYSNSMSEQFIIDWSIESDDYLSWFEKSQLEYDGEILFAEPSFEYDDLCKEWEIA